MRPRRAFNRNRRLRPREGLPDRLADLAARVGYGGNPEHKRNPGDFGLTPPSAPRPDKSLCDAVGIFRRADALQLLQEGIRRGCISEREAGDFPQNVWAVTPGGHPLEAQLENAGQGTYHGYPMPDDDPLRQSVLERWQQAAPRTRD